MTLSQGLDLLQIAIGVFMLGFHFGCRAQAKRDEGEERAEYERLRAKFGGEGGR